ncbi:MAG: helix-turn-helix domain-containing protein [Pseudomonas sp.]
MGITRNELGTRLRQAREASGLTQDDVAGHMELSRPTITQIELGNREVSSLELDKLARLLGRDIGELLADHFENRDALGALFRAHPEVLGEPHVADALRQCLAVGREVTNLERLLGIARDAEAGAVYPLAVPTTRWEAVQQGERVAEEERRRLGLGFAPLTDITDLLECEGLHTAVINLPDEVSGLTMLQEAIGILIATNQAHSWVRRRFSFAHEYAHALLDRNRLATVSRTDDRAELPEVRANVFAANFLMPAEGVRQFVAQIGKGGPSRQKANVFDESGVLEVSTRAAPKSQDIQLYEVAALAHHFGVSRLAALYRLKNMQLLSDSELETLKSQEESGLGDSIAKLLDLQEPDDDTDGNEFRRRIVNLALEAYRLEEISRSKLAELAAMIRLDVEQLNQLLQTIGLDVDERVEIAIPDAE